MAPAYGTGKRRVWHCERHGAAFEGLRHPAVRTLTSPARAFNTTPRFWLNLQTNHVVWEIEREKSLAHIRPIKRPRPALPLAS